MLDENDDPLIVPPESMLNGGTLQKSATIGVFVLTDPRERDWSRCNFAMFDVVLFFYLRDWVSKSYVFIHTVSSFTLTVTCLCSLPCRSLLSSMVSHAAARICGMRW